MDAGHRDTTRGSRGAGGHAGRPDSERERFRGYGVMGLPFESGHVLGPRRSPVSSIGPAYTSIWHRSPDGRWSFWSTAAPEVSRARGQLRPVRRQVSDDTHQTVIRLAWPEPYRLTVTADDPTLFWEVTFAATPVSRALSALAQRLPGPFLARESVLRVLGPVAGTLPRSWPPRSHRENAQPSDLPPGAVARLASHGKPRSPGSR
jgi:hypothetical protein